MLGDFDTLRRIQGGALALMGLGPDECAYHTIGQGARWRLRGYAGAIATPPLLIVASPIKRPYIWDLAPWISAVRRCLGERLAVNLLEWLPPEGGDGNAGIEDYAGQALEEAVRACSRAAGGARPFLIGHSLGGTLAAIFAATHPSSIPGLILLSSPLCFGPGCSRFRDALVAIAPSFVPMDVVPGTFLTQLSVVASPSTFVWSRLADMGLSVGDPMALEVHARVERWSLDEFPLPGRLVGDILQSLYREDSLYAGTLRVGGKLVRPSSLTVSTLAVINAADEIAPQRTVLPFLEGMPKGQAKLIEYSGERGVGIQHLALLVGRQSHASIWPRIASWIHERA